MAICRAWAGGLPLTCIQVAHLRSREPLHICFMQQTPSPAEVLSIPPVFSSRKPGWGTESTINPPSSLIPVREPASLLSITTVQTGAGTVTQGQEPVPTGIARECIFYTSNFSHSLAVPDSRACVWLPHQLETACRSFQIVSYMVACPIRAQQHAAFVQLHGSIYGPT